MEMLPRMALPKRSHDRTLSGRTRRVGRDLISLNCMRTSRFISLALLAGLYPLAEASASDKIDGLARLSSGDTLQIRFTSSGCFHFFTYDLTFSRAPKPTVSVAAVRLELDSPEPRARYHDAERRELG